MKLLLCINRFSDFKELFESIAASGGQLHSPLPDPASANFIYSLHYLQHDIDVCETGFGLFQTTFKVTKAISQKKYHLSLKASFCNAYKPELNIGDVVNVIKDKPANPSPALNGDGETAFADMYDLGLMDPESFPHTANYEAKRDKYKADIETGDGLGFVYPCMYERQPFYQINAVERNLATGEYDFEIARRKLNETLLDILQKL
jgi:hypothetical protein